MTLYRSLNRTIRRTRKRLINFLRAQSRETCLPTNSSTSRLVPRSLFLQRGFLVGLLVVLPLLYITLTIAKWTSGRRSGWRRLGREFVPMLSVADGLGVGGGKVGSVGVVAACRGRHEVLAKVMPSWVKAKGVSEVVLVDWGSDPPLQGMEGVKVVRVDGEWDWVLSRAYNLAIAMAGVEWVVRVDCDCRVGEGVVDKHFVGGRTPNPIGFWSGHWREARDSNEVHLNGAAIVRRADFLRVGGYDERIQTYGWDDEELFARLAKNGLKRHKIDFDVLEHVSHGDKMRLQRGVEFPEVNIDYNALLLEHLPTWRGAWTRRDGNSSLQAQEGNGLTLSRYEWVGRWGKNSIGVKLETVSKPTALTKLVSEVERNAAWSLALGRRLHDTYGMCWDLMSRMGGKEREVFLRKLGRGKSEKGRIVVVHVMHGLGNRLRALGSALAFAKKTDRVSVVVWEKDRHCEARFGDLFERRMKDGEEVVVVDGIGLSWPFEGARMYDGMWVKWDTFNYMRREGGGAKKDAVVMGNSTKNVYFKAAYVMQTEPHGLAGWDAANGELRKLVAVKQIRDVVEGVDEKLRESIGVHIRHLDTGIDIGNVDARTEYGSVDAGVIDYWRNASSPGTFVVGVHQALEELDSQGQSVEQVFVAGDDTKWAEAMAEKMERGMVWWLEDADEILGCQKIGRKRSMGCLKRALADLLCLARTRLVLGSMWSSFSEAAARLGYGELRLAGVDFGDEEGVEVERILQKYGAEVADVVAGVRRKRRRKGESGRHKLR